MKFNITKNGKHVGQLEGNDGREIGGKAILRWGPGTYDISMVREEEDIECCPGCGEETPDTELDMHNGVCKTCYDDFGDPMFEDDEED